MILEEERALLLINVESQPGEPAVLQRSDDSLGVDELAARGVDQGCAGPEHGQAGAVDEVVRLRRERAVQRDDVRLAEQRVEAVGVGASDGAVRVAEGWALEDVVPEQAAPEAGGEDLRCREPDLAGADDADGLAAQRVAEQALQLEVAFAHPVVGLVRVSVECLDERDGELGDGGG